MTININLSTLFGVVEKIKEESTLLKEGSQCNQNKPVGFYVYGHFNSDIPFYIGKGCKKRAWSSKRNIYWDFYVKHHLQGQYKTIIIQDNMTEEESECLENSLMAKESGNLLNIIDFGRITNLDENNSFHEQRKSNLECFEKGFTYEKKDINRSIALYKKAIKKIDNYAFINCEGGLLGRVMQEEKEVNGYKGELQILDRITICLVKVKNKEEAKVLTIEYFKKYKRDLNLKKAIAIKRRVGII